MPRHPDPSDALVQAAQEGRLDWRISGRGLSYRIREGDAERLLRDGERTAIAALFRGGRLDRGSATVVNGRAQRGPVVVTNGERLRQARAAARNQEATP